MEIPSDPGTVAEEQGRADRLRRAVDVACALLRQGRFSRAEAVEIVAATREQALELFPGKGDVFDLVLAPRFARILDEVYAPPAPARVLPFRQR
jgi:hypothetical protein